MKIKTIEVKKELLTALLNRLLISKAIYKENCFSIDCDQRSISLKLFLPFRLLTLAVLGNKHILFALAWFHIAHKYTKMCPLTDRLLFVFAILSIRNTFWLKTVTLKISHELEYNHACQDIISWTE